jgi:Bacterial toxin 33
MEFADHEPRPEQIDIQTDQGFSPKVSEENSAPLKNEVDYSKIPAGFKKGYNLWDLPTSPPERAKEHSNGAMPVAKSSGVSGKAETGTARNEHVVSGSQVAYNSQDSPTPTRDSTESGKASQPSKAGGLAGNQDTRIAQFSENGVYEDPFTGLFKVIVGGVITITVDTWGAANELLQRALQSSNDNSSSKEDKSKKEERNPAQDKKLSQGEIAKLKKGDIDIHELKDEENASKRDLFKDKDGNIYVKPKGGRGPGEETGLNINNY